MNFIVQVLVSCLCLLVFTRDGVNNVSAETAAEFLKEFNKNFVNNIFDAIVAVFTKTTNITTYNTERSANASLVHLNISNSYRQRANLLNLTGVKDDHKRQLKLLLATMSPSNQEVATKIVNIANKMENIYSEGCVPNNPKVKNKLAAGKTCLKLDNEIVPILATSRDPEELLYLWKGWRDEVGPKLPDLYETYVENNNIGAKENGFQDAGDYKRKRYEVNNLKESAESFWNDLKPFYEEVHAYVRYKLTKKYPNIVDKDGPIPAHVFGNMWAQSWENIYDIVEPYKGEPQLDITPTLKKKYNVSSMFVLAEEFFVSLGWQKLPKQFWTKSMLVKPPDRNVTCHASAWDLRIKVGGEPDVRVRMCTNIDQNDFITIHHELGHIYYFLKYWNQPSEYRTGANPGFHEAVGDTIALSVQTPNHLQKIGLLDKVSSSEKADINFLMKTALERIAFLPFSYLMDQWMWNVYSGEIKREDYNKAWWEMRLKYQGIKPPVERTENDFDPGAKFHIPADTPYIRYFFAHILQFTFHKHACAKTEHTGPLHQCSIYNSTDAGKLLGDMLAMGKSKPWEEALQTVTGKKELSADPIHEYFASLTEWLKKERSKQRYPIGWEDKNSASNQSKATLSLLFSTLLFLYSGLK